ncbi:hypothetical protein ACA30_05785 [Virgibacillus soli]|nr:hypothetical protein ACA30_05785 [Virgibacillus soli]
MARGKGNKAVLEGINYSLEIVKKVKANEEFSQDGKERILTDYVGMSKDNNSFFSPYEICQFIKDALGIKQGKVADLSGGIGSMIQPFIKEYGKLDDGIQFDCYELDENNSLAGSMAWSDYDQVNYYGQFNSIERHDEIPGNFDYVIGNPPFSGSVPYLAEWNNNKGKIKNNDICNAFVDMAIRKTRDKGYIALVLPTSHMFKSQATEKMRVWMKSQVALKGVFPLDQDTFKDSGVKGTKVGTVLCIWQRGAKQGEIFYGHLQDKDDLVGEMKAMARQFRVFLSGDYDIRYASDSSSGLCGYMEQRLKSWQVIS